jgi:SAM-dependent methyltransferase
VIDPGWKRRRQSRRRPAGKPGTSAASPGWKRRRQSRRRPAGKPGTSAASPGRSFGRVAVAYDLGRPSWPAEGIDRVARELELRPGATVLDLGAGTGKLTRLLVDRFARVVAVEPDEAMRALILAEAEVLAGTAEEIPLEDQSVSAVFCGESFHWFDWPPAIAEIVRVLEPLGGLVLMWNRPSGGLDSAEWPQGVSHALDRLVDPSPPERRYRSFAWRDALAGSPFEELRSAVVLNRGELDRAGLLARIESWSQVATLPDGDREAFLAEVADHLTEPSYRATLETHLYWTRLAS